MPGQWQKESWVADAASGKHGDHPARGTAEGVLAVPIQGRLASAQRAVDQEARAVGPHIPGRWPCLPCRGSVPSRRDLLMALCLGQPRSPVAAPAPGAAAWRRAAGSAGCTPARAAPHACARWLGPRAAAGQQGGPCCRSPTHLAAQSDLAAQRPEASRPACRCASAAPAQTPSPCWWRAGCLPRTSPSPAPPRSLGATGLVRTAELTVPRWLACCGRLAANCAATAWLQELLPPAAPWRPAAAKEKTASMPSTLERVGSSEPIQLYVKPAGSSPAVEGGSIKPLLADEPRRQELRQLGLDAAAVTLALEMPRMPRPPAPSGPAAAASGSACGGAHPRWWAGRSAWWRGILAGAWARGHQQALNDTRPWLLAGLSPGLLAERRRPGRHNGSHSPLVARCGVPPGLRRSFSSQPAWPCGPALGPAAACCSCWRLRRRRPEAALEPTATTGIHLRPSMPATGSLGAPRSKPGARRLA